MTLPFQNTLQFAQHLDQQDTLHHFRNQFHIPQKNGKDLIYLCGNSLGFQPKKTKELLDNELLTWQNLGVEGWFESDWLGYLKHLKKPLAKLAGALPSEVTVMNNLTVNLHLMLATFYQPTSQKFKILTEAGAFPSDQYALETHLKFKGIDPKEAIIEIAPRAGKHTLRTEDILQKIEENKDSLALVMMSGINYYTGQVFDMQAIAKKSNELNIRVGFDLAHAIGNVSLALHDWGVDFAVWCSYKYLNSGPGGIAGVFVHEKHHQNQNLPRLAGWWGYDEVTRFKMKQGFVPMAGADGWQLSTPSILSMACHRAALEVFESVDFEKLRRKSELMSLYLDYILQEVNKAKSNIFEIITPTKLEERGCQISILVQKEGKKYFDFLVQNHIIGDWREPNVIRLSPVPLYNTFEELWRVGECLSEP